MHRRELLPYKILIEENLIPSIMIAHTIFPALDPTCVATVSDCIVNNLLRNELGFNGVITTDSMTMAGIARQYGVAEACAMSLAAGVDLVLMKAENSLREETFNRIFQYVDEGKIAESELDNKIERILSLKKAYNHFNWHTEPMCENIAHDPAKRLLAEDIASKTVFLLKDKKKCLPLKQTDSILLIEQITDTPNDYWWHPGMLAENCWNYHPGVKLLEISLQATNEDCRRVKDCLENNSFDTVIMTNYYRRASLPNNDLVRFVQSHCRKLILIVNTPYKLNWSFS